MTKRVYIDSGVLITALQVNDRELAMKALAEISRDDVEYVFGPLVELEVLPKPMKHNAEQAAFFQAWFANAKCFWYSQEIHQLAIQQVSDFPIAPMDATHVATAIFAGADELLTSEGTQKPMFMQKAIPVRSIRAEPA